MRHRPGAWRALILSGSALPLAAAASVPQGHVSAGISGLRSDRGQVLACLTARPGAFPDCQSDPAARRLAVPIHGRVELDFGAVPPGRYAIALIHDENGNGKLDKRLMIPREGFGFSRDAPVRMGPPSFAQAAFTVGDAGHRQTIHVRYML